MTEISGRPYWEIHFDDNGALNDGDPSTIIAQIAGSSVNNLFVFSHGWNNQPAQAQQLYQEMFPLLADAAAGHPELGTVGFIGIVWPSIWWPDTAGPAASTTVSDAQSIEQSATGPVNVDTTMTGAQITQAMSASFDPARQSAILAMGQLIDRGQQRASDPSATPEQQSADVIAFHTLLQQITHTPSGTPAQEDSGESALFASDDPIRDYQALATTMSTSTSGTTGDAQSFGIDFQKIWNGAKDSLRTASFWEMKKRAGAIGAAGLGPLLAALHSAAPNLRIHLIGHSFGARLVSFSLQAFTSPSSSPVASLLLLQGAFSHWSFAGAQDMPFGHAGAMNGYADRVHGPLVATFSQYDWAVGHWYPKAAFLARDDTQDKSVDQWGGMGSDGFQASTPQASITIGPAGSRYTLTSGTFHCADGNGVILDTSQSAFAGAHSDILHPEIAWLATCAAASGS